MVIGTLKAWIGSCSIALGAYAMTAQADTPTTPRSQTVNAAQLTNALNRLDTARSSDQFEVSSDHASLAGKSFAVDLPLLRDRAPGWIYDPASKKLTIFPEPNLHALARNAPRPFSEANGSRSIIHGYAGRRSLVNRDKNSLKTVSCNRWNSC